MSSQSPGQDSAEPGTPNPAISTEVEDVPMTSDQVDDLDASKSSVKLPEVDSNSNRVVDMADAANISVNAFQTSADIVMENHGQDLAEPGSSTPIITNTYSLLSDGISAPIVGPAEAQVTDSAEVIPDDDIQMSTDQVEVDASDATRNESVGIAWSGFVDPVYTPKFSVNAFQVSGTVEDLGSAFGDSLKWIGRIPPNQVWDYISMLQSSFLWEIILLELTPASADQKKRFDDLHHFLKKRDRFAVIKPVDRTLVKDIYIIPLAHNEDLHPSLLPLNGPGLRPGRGDGLLALIVKSKQH